MCASTTISLRFSEGNQSLVTLINQLYSYWHDLYNSWHNYCIMTAILFNQVSGFLFLERANFRIIQPKVFFKKRALKNFVKFTGKDLYRCVTYITLQAVHLTKNFPRWLILNFKKLKYSFENVTLFFEMFSPYLFKFYAYLFIYKKQHRTTAFIFISCLIPVIS